ncbi:MAG: hypothetical protein RIM84_06590 [Alphaproteobacteria bacterium]
MRIFLTAALACLGWTTAATAAPQVLALVSTDTPVTIACTGGDCTARFTSFCLQPDRAAPTGGQRYSLAAADTVELTGTTADGTTLRLDPARAGFKASHNHVSVMLSLSRGDVERLGLRQVSVRVSDDAALVPVPEAGDPNPQTEADLALATTVLRQLGRKMVDEDRVRMAAARETIRLVNAIPAGRLTVRAARAEVDRVLTPQRIAALPAAARPFVTDARDYCTLVSRNDQTTSLRQCLEAEHDSMMYYMNQDYWDALKGGS